MDKITTDLWERMVTDIQKASPEKRKHFAQMVMLLAKCYIDELDHKAVVIVDTGKSVVTFAAGADEMEMADLVMQAHEATQAITMYDAPPKELFN
jgi:hypothetical protein